MINWLKGILIFWGLSLLLMLAAMGLCLLLDAMGVQAQSTPTATPTPSTPAMCTVTGNVLQADGSPLVNGVITLNSKTIQVINGVVVNPTNVSTNTDTQGNIRAISLPQGLVVQITVCPPATGQGQSATCAASYSAFIPFTQTANFGQLSQGVALSATGALTANTVTVNQLFNAPDTSVWNTSGLSLAKNLSLATTSTLTFPDGSTYTSAGHNNMKGIGIGAVAPPLGTGFTTPMMQLGSLALLSNTYTSATKTEPNMNFAMGVHSDGTNWIADTETAAFFTADMVGTALGVSPESEMGWQFYAGQTIGSTLSTANRIQYLAIRPTGEYLENGGITILKSASATAPSQRGGLTIGGSSLGGHDIDIADTVNGSALAQITNASTGASSQSKWQLVNDSGVVGGMGLTGHSSTFGGAYGPDVLYINNSGPGGVGINAFYLSGNTGGSVNVDSADHWVGRFFYAQDHFEGLAVTGYAGMANGDSIAGLSIGNSYISATGWADVNISGAAYWNPTTGQWLTDGGAGSGTNLYQQAQANYLWYTGPAQGSGQVVTWTRQMAITPNGILVTHLFNDTTMSAPTLSNGSLMSGSRDTFGYILPTSWPVHITFGRPLPGGFNAGCIAIGGAGTSGLFYTNNQSSTGIDIGCVNYAGGPVCSPIWFQYVCFGVG